MRYNVTTKGYYATLKFVSTPTVYIDYYKIVLILKGLHH